ncbi:MAG: hypothetical protein V8Q42_06325 [Anaerovoracaceae bacterium]
MTRKNTGGSLPELDEFPENVISIMAYSLSKTQTLYGTRCGAMICIARTKEIADEFKRVCENPSKGFMVQQRPASHRRTWSRIYGDPELLADVDAEKKLRSPAICLRQEERLSLKPPEKQVLDIVPFDVRLLRVDTMR